MKRFLSMFVAIIVALSMCGGMAYAIEYGVYSSYTLHSYNAQLRAGSTRGTINIAFDVKSSKMADSIGVSSIGQFHPCFLLPLRINFWNFLLCRSDSFCHSGPDLR